MNKTPNAQLLRRALAISCLVLSTGIPVAAGAETPTAAVNAGGVIRVKSAHAVDETVARIKASVEAKGIHYFGAIDQKALGDGASLPIRRSTLVLFGNPPLGVQFIQSNPYAALDWPVRMLVRELDDGTTEIAWTDFAYIGQRYGITGKEMQLKMASEVAQTIASEAGE